MSDRFPIPTSRGENKIAVKDWSVVIDALGNGRQILLLRKYQPAYREFLLQPTYNYPVSSFKDEYQKVARDNKSQKMRGIVQINHYAEVKEVIEIEDPRKLGILSNEYIWTFQHVLDYFKEEKAFIWLLRVYKLTSFLSVKPTRSMIYEKCEEPISSRGSTPVLSDSEFTLKVSNIKSSLELPMTLGKEEVNDEISTLRRKIQELEEKLREKDDIIRGLKSSPNILTDLELQKFSEHDQLVYKLGVVLLALDFRDIQLDLSRGMETPPFIIGQKVSFKARDREYDVKAEYEGILFVWEVHDKGMLIPTLVKLNELTTANRALVLFGTEDERELRKEARRNQFRNLISVPPFELRRYLKSEIEELYEFCKTVYTLRHQIETQQQKLVESTQLLNDRRNKVLQKPSFFEEIL